MRALLHALALGVSVAVVACSGAFNSEALPDPNAEPVKMPGPANAPLPVAGGAPVELPGVDTSNLSRREQELFSRLVSQLYSPCAKDAVSLAQCVRENRSCVACKPAVKLIADKVHEGALAEQAQTVYGIRFGPNVKQIDVADSPSKGPENAPVTVVEWFDFECPHCKLTKPILDRLVAEHAGKVRLVVKFYPLHSHARAEPAARAAIAAQNQGRFWEMEQVLFSHGSELQDTDLLGYARDLRLDMARFATDMKSSKTDAILARDRADAEKLGLNGTPFIFINGREFELGLFHIESDLDPWVELELKLKGAG